MKALSLLLLLAMGCETSDREHHDQQSIGQMTDEWHRLSDQMFVLRKENENLRKELEDLYHKEWVCEARLRKGK